MIDVEMRQGQPPLESTQVRVVIVHDQPIFLVGLKTLIDGTNGMDVVGEAHTSARAIELIDIVKPNVVVSNILLPDLHGISLVGHNARE